jgi:hypothetical protein
MDMKKEYISRLILIVSSIVISVLLAEAVLQLFDVPAPVFSGWRNKSGEAETNEIGFRGQKINYTDDDYVIVLVGDSQVAGAALSFDGLPERRLEYHLNRMANKKNVKVFSIGGVGYGQDQELLILKKYYETFRADLVVLWLTPFNDVWNNVFPTHWPENGRPKPTFWLADGKLQGPSEQMGETLRWSKFKLFALANRQFQFIDRDGDWEKHLPEAYKPLAFYDGKTCNDWQAKWDNGYPLMREDNLATEKSHYALALTPTSPRSRYGMELTRSLLHEFDALATKNNGKFVLFEVKLPKKPDDDICPEDEVVHLLNGKYYKTSRKQYDDNWQYIETGFSAFTIPVTANPWQADIMDERHLNEQANDQVMGDLARLILPLIR